MKVRTPPRLLPALLLLVMLASAGRGTADIISTTGTLVLGVSTGNVCHLTATGLGVGVTTPSTNLHVAGNAVVGSALVAGGTDNTSGSNLHVNGSLGMSVQTVTSDTTLSGNTMVFADTSAADLTLTLPAASSAAGRLYIVKKTASGNTVRIDGTVDNLEGLLLTQGGNMLPCVQLLSNGNTWLLAGLGGNVVSGATASANLVGWWKLDETGGATAADASGRGNTGTLSGLTFAGCAIAGRVGGALSFDGTNDYVDCGDPNIYESLDVITVCAWINVTDNAAQHPVAAVGAYYNGTSSWYFGSHTSTPSWTAWSVANNPYKHHTGSGPFDTVNLGSWQHVAWTYNRAAASAVMYRNGASWATGVNAGSWIQIPSSAVNLRLGSASNGAYFRGGIDDLRIYNKALSAAEILRIYNAGVAQ